MAEQGEASTTSEKFRSGKEEGGEGSAARHGVADGTEKKAGGGDHRAGGDPLNSHREPLVADGIDRGKSAASPSAASPGISAAQDGPFRGFLPMPAMENWPFNPSTPGAGFDFNALGPLVPVLLPGPFPTYYPIPGQDQQPLPGGLFAVPVMPMCNAMGTIPQSGFIPLSFNLPPVAPPSHPEGQTHAAAPPAPRPAEAGRAAPQAEAREVAPNGLRQRPVAVAARARQGVPRQQGDPQRQQQVVRRFQVGFQVDVLLILKLAVVVVVFNQDGTRDRLMLLLLLAVVVYLYQTGALAPILRWISLSAQRAMMPPQQPLPAAEGPPNAEGVGVGVHPPNARDAPIGPEVREDTPPAAPGPNGAAGQGEEPPPGVDELRVEHPPQNPNWWGIIKELQMIVVGFLTSLLPGFQHVE
ncbi:unnamed protein product [Calypogeia fissa]